jgi:AraC-like DNA-binding protein
MRSEEAEAAGNEYHAAMMPDGATPRLEESDTGSLAPVAAGVRERQLALAPRLRPHVESLVLLDTPRPHHLRLPGPRVQILARATSGGFAAWLVGPLTSARRKPSPARPEIARANELVSGRDDSVIRPAITRRSGLVSGNASLRAIAARFAPGAARLFLPCPLSEVTDAIVPLAEIWRDGACLEDRLAAARDPLAAAAVLSAAIEPRLAPRRDACRLVSAATALLDRGIGVAETAARLGIGERRLGRVLRDETGLSPKAYARAMRLRRALAFHGAPRRARSWAETALAAGYADQAHMIAEFRSLAGVTPPALEAELASLA